MTAQPRPRFSAPTQRLPVVDAWRGAAALAVLAYHARSLFWVGLSEMQRRHGVHPNFDVVAGWLSAPLGLGWLGVPLFFVLSGYCIHRRPAQALAHNPGHSPDWAAFYRRRFWRIYPTYAAALILTAVVDAALERELGAPLPGQCHSFAAFAISLLTLQGYAAPAFGSGLIFWTLAMEMHFYLAYPLLFLLSRRAGCRAVLMAVSGSWLVYEGMNSGWNIEAHLFSGEGHGVVFLAYWPAWALGFMLAETEAARFCNLSRRSCWVAAGLGAAAGIAATVMGWYVVGSMAWSIVFVTLLRESLALTRCATGWRMIGAALARVGAFSYSLYAIQGSVLAVLAVSTGMTRSESLLPTVGAVLVTIIAARLFFQGVERWSVKWPGASPAAACAS